MSARASASFLLCAITGLVAAGCRAPGGDGVPGDASAVFRWPVPAMASATVTKEATHPSSKSAVRGSFVLHAERGGDCAAVVRCSDMRIDRPPGLDDRTADALAVSLQRASDVSARIRLCIDGSGEIASVAGFEDAVSTVAAVTGVSDPDRIADVQARAWSDPARYFGGEWQAWVAVWTRALRAGNPAATYMDTFVGGESVRVPVRVEWTAEPSGDTRFRLTGRLDESVKRDLIARLNRTPSPHRGGPLLTDVGCDITAEAVLAPDARPLDVSITRAIAVRLGDLPPALVEATTQRWTFSWSE